MFQSPGAGICGANRLRNIPSRRIGSEPRAKTAAPTNIRMDRAHPAGTPALRSDDQHCRVIRVRDGTSDRGGEVFYHHRFLALVGRSSVGRAVIRILCRRHERLSTHGDRFDFTQFGGAHCLFRDHLCLPGWGAWHRASPLLGWRSESLDRRTQSR
jgi:hypothetical protein